MISHQAISQFEQWRCWAGLFIQFTCDESENITIPDELEPSITFGVPIMTEASGDGEAIRDEGRQLIRVHLGKDIGKALSYSEKTLSLDEIKASKTG